MDTLRRRLKNLSSRPPSGDLVDDAGKSVASFQDTNDLPDLNNSIESYERSLRKLVQTQDQRTAISSKLGDCYHRRFRITKDGADIDKAIKLYREAILQIRSTNPLQPSFSLELSRCYISRYNLAQSTPDLDRAIDSFSRAIEMIPPGHQSQSTAHKERGDALCLRYNQSATKGDLSDAIAAYQAAKGLCKNDDDLWPILDSLGQQLLELSRITGQENDVGQAIACHQTALGLRGEGGPFEIQSLRSLGRCFKRRFEITKAESDVVEAGDCFRRASRLSPTPLVADVDDLATLDSLFWDLFAQTQDVTHLDSEIDLEVQILRIYPEGDPKHTDAARNLAISLDERYQRTGDLEDVGRAIELKEMVLAARQEGHPDHADALRELSLSLDHRFQQTGELSDISRSIELKEQILVLRPDDHQDHVDAVRELAASIDHRFQKSGHLEDGNRAIELKEVVLRLYPESHARHGDALRELAASLDHRFRRTGDATDISRAITLKERLLALCPQNHPEHTEALRELAISLDHQFQQNRKLSDIDRAIDLKERVLLARTTEHPQHADALRELSTSLDNRFQQTQVLQDINRAIDLNEQLLKLCPPGHLAHADAMRELAISLSNRYQQSGDAQDGDRAIELKEKLCVLYPDGNQYHADAVRELAISLDHRFQKKQVPEDINRAIELKERLLALCPEGDPNHADALRELAISLEHRCRFQNHKADTSNRNSDRGYIMKLYREASRDGSAQVLDRLSVAVDWAQSAKQLGDQSEMEALIQIHRLIDTVVAQSYSLEGQYIGLSGSNPVIRQARQVVVNAAALAIAGGRTELAVRLLEQGRSVVFRQFRQLRVHLDDVRFVAPELAERFTVLSGELENLAVTSSSRSRHAQKSGTTSRPVDDDSEYLAARHYAKVSKEWLGAVEEIRSIYGFHSFLQPPSFSELQRAADAGPIIIINIGSIRSDAIVILRQLDRPIIVPLPLATPDPVRRLADAFSLRPAELDTSKAIFLLREIWRIICEPVVKELRKHAPDLPLGSRVWLLPTGDAVRLPLHAAGPYKTGERDMLHLFTSSYTPSLTALVQARQRRLTDSSTIRGSPSVLILGQGNTEGEKELPRAGDEVQSVMRYAQSCTTLEGPFGTRDAVLSGIFENPWVHLVCHGHHDEVQPFSSHFSLHDGPLSLLDLIRKEVPQAEFAFLSACHSAGGSRDMPDEHFHPAASMMLAGFSSVVATMWALDDSVGPEVAGAFYREMLGRKEPKGAADAAGILRRVVMKLGRKQEIPFMQMINLVHYGI